MFIKADEDRFINRNSIFEIVRYDNCVYFMGSNRRKIGTRKFDSIGEAIDYCDKLITDINTDGIGSVAEKVENIGYNMCDLLEEMKKIRRVLEA